MAQLDLKPRASTAAASKLKKRGSKSKRGTGPALSPEDELLVQQQLDAEARASPRERGWGFSWAQDPLLNSTAALWY